MNFGVIAKRLGAFAVRHAAMTLLAVYDRMPVTFQGENLFSFPSQWCGLKHRTGHSFANNLLEKVSYLGRY